ALADRRRAAEELAEALAVGVAVAGGVRVVDPPELPVRDDEVRVRVVREERRDELLALDDVAMEDEPALVGDLAGHEHVRVAEPQREQDAVPQRPDADAALAAV